MGDFKAGDKVELTRNVDGVGKGTRFVVKSHNHSDSWRCEFDREFPVYGYEPHGHYWNVPEGSMKKVNDDGLWFVAVVRTEPHYSIDVRTGNTSWQEEWGSSARVVKGKDSAVKEAERLAKIFPENEVKIGQFSETCKHSTVVWEK